MVNSMTGEYLNHYPSTTVLQSRFVCFFCAIFLCIAQSDLVMNFPRVKQQLVSHF